MGTNLVFTSDEFKIINNADFLVKKRLISERIANHLASLSTDLQQMLEPYNAMLADEIINTKPRVSRGENYEHLPYIILDYPRVFTPADVFAFRTMFRWANYFSCTVQLSGIYLQHFRNAMKGFIESSDSFYIGISDDEWQHHFRPDNYRKTTDILKDKKLFKTVLTTQPYFKAAIKIPLNNYAKVNTAAANFYENFLKHYCKTKAAKK